MQTTASSAPPPAPRRFISVDALRGFDMLWIVGAGGLVSALDKMAGQQTGGILNTLARQLSHKEWEGFAFEDLIFPLFVFMVGISITFSLGRAMTESGPRAAYLRIFRRFVLLYIVALLYSGGFAKLWPDIRLMGVLNRIALCYLFTSLAFCHLKARGLAVLCGSILLGYWAMMATIPFPDLRPRDAQGALISSSLTVRSVQELNWGSTNILRGVYEPGLNLAHYVDQKYLPGKKWEGTWDPEGFVSTLPAIGTCLLGALAGLLLKSSSISDSRKVAILAGAGVAGVLIGFAWGTQFPVIKKIWTSSYVLVAGGYSALLLAAFHQVIEVWGWKAWAQPFIWVGSNAITIYLANNIIGFKSLAQRFAGGDVAATLDRYLGNGAGDLLLAMVTVGIGLALVRFLYQRKIFLRL